MKPNIIAIVGPTSIGKSKIAIELALKLNGEIISADSMQIYRKMDIGTAKITPKEMKNIQHHMIDIVDPDQTFSVADFQQLAKLKIYEILALSKVPILVGGTGLYIRSILDVYEFQEQPIDEKRRHELMELAKSQGNHHVHLLLQKVDPKLAAKLHANDIRRVVRGIEYYELTGNKMSEVNSGKIKENNEFQPIMIGLNIHRDILYDFINTRVDKMVEEGLIEEVKNLLLQGYSPKLTSMQGLGYKEIIGYLHGEYDLKEAVRILKRNTRHYAKRQLTWFRKDERIKWFNVNPNQLDENVQSIYDYIAGLLIL